MKFSHNQLTNYIEISQEWMNSLRSFISNL